MMSSESLTLTSATAKQLARLNAQYIDGLVNGRSDWFEAHLADDFLCIESDGTLRTKAAFVEKVRAGTGLAAYRLDDIQVRIFGETALIHATGVFTRRDGGRGVSRYTDVYARVDGEWKVVAAQVTRAEGAAIPDLKAR